MKQWKWDEPNAIEQARIHPHTRTHGTFSNISITKKSSKREKKVSRLPLHKQYVEIRKRCEPKIGYKPKMLIKMLLAIFSPIRLFFYFRFQILFIDFGQVFSSHKLLDYYYCVLSFRRGMQCALLTRHKRPNRQPSMRSNFQRWKTKSVCKNLSHIFFY